MNRKALVTGRSGFIGSHLEEGLLEQGYDVVGIDVFYRLILKGWLIAVLEGNKVEIFGILRMVGHGQ
ncbi:NAD-dependent epimerase/dehydratase family protein [candidate division WOR-3 bacterium]|nr:NAD-dependent epimerase/dehydratase family protein [candidate division WOR-3 bacterium]